MLFIQGPVRLELFCVLTSFLSRAVHGQAVLSEKNMRNPNAFAFSGCFRTGSHADLKTKTRWENSNLSTKLRDFCKYFFNI